MNTYNEATMYHAALLDYYRSIGQVPPVKKLYHIYHKDRKTSEFSYRWSLWMADWQAEIFIETFYLPVLDEDKYGYRIPGSPLTFFDGRDVDHYYERKVIDDEANYGCKVAEDIKWGVQDVYGVAMISHDTYTDLHIDDRNDKEFPGIVDLIDRVNAGEQITTISVL